MQTSLVLNQRKPWREICFPNGEWVLALALALELGIFATIGENFFTLSNFFEVVRLSVELCTVYWHYLLLVWVLLFGLLFSGNDNLGILLTLCGLR